MRFLIQVLLIVILAAVFELFLPWWSIAFAAFIGGYIFHTRLNFLAGFLAIALLWFVAAFIIDLSAGAPLTERVAEIFFSIPKPVLLLVTALIGALVGGFAAMAGGALQKGKKRSRYY